MVFRLKNYVLRIYKTLWMQLLILFAAMPLYVYVSLKANDGADNLEFIIQNGISLLYPICIMLGMTVSLAEEVNAKGREVLYQYRRGCGLEAVAPWLFLLLVMGFMHCFIWKYLLYPGLFYLKNALMLGCFTGLFYFTAFLFFNLTPALVCCFGFYLVTLTKPFGLFNLVDYDESLFFSLSSLLYNEKEYLIIGCLGWIGGIIANKYYHSYD